MSHSYCFHRVILAYLIFIFTLFSVGCGYKDSPFYAPSSKDETSKGTNKSSDKNQNNLFYGIDSVTSDYNEE